MSVIYSDIDLRNIFRKNPILSSFSAYLPTNIKDIFKWCEFIVSNVPVAAAGIKKISETTITNFKYNVGDDFNETNINLKDSWKKIIEEELGMKAKLIEISYNLETYGNAFVSVYRPFNRTLKCKTCGNTIPIQSARNLTFKVTHPTHGDSKEHNSKSYDYSSKLKAENETHEELIANCYCGKCKNIMPHEIIDLPIKDVSKTNIILWNPHQISIEYNPISGRTNYYYTIEDDVKKAIEKNNRLFLETTPKEMILSVLTDKKFKFNEKSIYHARKHSISGVTTVWGIPKLVAAIPAVLTYMIYNKANEKIAMDYLVPLRTVYPEGTGQGELYNFMSGASVADKLKDIINKWKIDPSGIQVTPFPVGTQQILGDGKMLNLDQELNNKEVSIANALGVPIEFIKGGLSYTSQGPSLRLLENQMAKNQYDMNNIIMFVVNEVASILNKEPVNISLLPFKIIDDLQEKATIVQLAAQGGGFISTGTLLELFNLDANSERRRTTEEQKEQIKEQLELQHYQQEVQQSIEEKAREQNIMNQSRFNNLNQQALLQEAENQVEQLMQMDEGQRRSVLDEMAKTNYIMYATVKSLLEMKERKMIYQTGKQAVSGQQQ